MIFKVVLITGSELRHEFFRKFIASNSQIKVLATYCESEKGNLNQIIESESTNSLRRQHLNARKITENDFLEYFVITSSTILIQYLLRKAK